MNKKPKIRFKGFTNDWEQCKVRDLINKKLIESPMDGNHGEKHPKATDYVEYGIPFLMATDINNGKVDLQHCKFISEAQSLNLDKGFAKNGDILITHKATIGVSAILNGLTTKYAILTPQVTYYRVINTNRLNKNYLYVCFQSHGFQKEINEMATQSTRAYIGIQQQQKLSLNMSTSIKEQNLIGKFFINIDKLITLHQRKCEKLKNIKKSLLEKMFPKNNEKIPAIRFKGFTNDWEQCKVSELLTERKQQSPMCKEYPLMAFIANEGVAPKGERYDRSALINDTEKKLYKRTELGDFIYSSNNLEAGSIGLNKYGKASISPVYSIFYPTEIADSNFLGYRLVRKDFINDMLKWRQGVIYGQWKIHESDFIKIEICAPFVEEQQKIGSFLETIDKLITLHQRKLEKLQNIKKALLEKMFV